MGQIPRHAVHPPRRRLTAPSATCKTIKAATTQKYFKVARIDGVAYPVRCRVRVISGFSAHADEHELDDWIGNFARAGGTTGGDGKPKRVFVTHGDPDAAEAFAVRIRSVGLDAHLPTYLETVQLR